MAKRIYGKGDLCCISTKEETSYGTTGTADPVHMGVMDDLVIDPGVTVEESPDCGSRLQGTKYQTGRDITATLSFHIAKNADWIDWFKWVLGVDSDGKITGLTNTPSGKTVLCRVAPESVDRLTGAYVNQLTVTSEKIGKPLSFQAQIYAKGHTPDLDVDGADRATGTPLRATTGWTCNNSTIGTVTAGKWTLTITQNLVKCAGADDDDVTNESGQEPYLGSPEVTLELTRPASGRELDILKETVTTGLNFSTQIGGYSVVVSGGVLDTAGTKRTAANYDETIKVTATDIRITTASS